MVGTEVLNLRPSFTRHASKPRLREVSETRPLRRLKKSLSPPHVPIMLPPESIINTCGQMLTSVAGV